ncbi:hypothetical protein EC930056_0404, partial [Escherichia coli 93.0056]
STNIIPVAV